MNCHRNRKKKRLWSTEKKEKKKKKKRTWTPGTDEKKHGIIHPRPKEQKPVKQGKKRLYIPAWGKRR